jgi:uncharacterized caspase-like protein
MRGGIAFFLLWLCLATSASAEERVALVIGNSAYAGAGVLPNPSGDAALIAETLESDGFKVTLVQDANRAAMLKAMRGFSDKADKADWALVYYAGHGIEIGGVNFLLPTDVELREDRDAQDEAISLNRVLDAVAGARKLRLVILDACRNNPFAARMKRSIYERSVVDRGLAPAEPQAGILVVYSAEAGHVADDGAGGHSPFTAALARRIEEPGLEISRLFNVVTADVLEATGDRQRPYQYGSNPTREALYMKAPAAAPEAAATTTSIPDSATKAITAAIDAATSPDQLTPWLAILPAGPLKERAGAREEELKNGQMASLSASGTSASTVSGCMAEFDRLRRSGDLGDAPDREGFLRWCSETAGVGPAKNDNMFVLSDITDVTMAERRKACETQFSEKARNGDLGRAPNKDGYIGWCVDNARNVSVSAESSRASKETLTDCNADFEARKSELGEWPDRIGYINWCVSNRESSTFVPAAVCDATSPTQRNNCEAEIARKLKRGGLEAKSNQDGLY